MRSPAPEHCRIVRTCNQREIYQSPACIYTADSILTHVPACTILHPPFPSRTSAVLLATAVHHGRIVPPAHSFGIACACPPCPGPTGARWFHRSAHSPPTGATTIKFKSNALNVFVISASESCRGALTQKPWLNGSSQARCTRLIDPILPASRVGVHHNSSLLIQNSSFLIHNSSSLMNKSSVLLTKCRVHHLQHAARLIHIPSQIHQF